MRQDQRGGIATDRLAEHLGDPDHLLIDTADIQRHHLDDVAPRVKQHHTKSFILQPVQFGDQELRGVVRRADLPALLRWGRGQTCAEFERRFQARGGGRADAVEVGQFQRTRGEDLVQRAEVREQALCDLNLTRAADDEASSSSAVQAVLSLRTRRRAARAAAECATVGAGKAFSCALPRQQRGEMPHRIGQVALFPRGGDGLTGRAQCGDLLMALREFPPLRGDGRVQFVHAALHRFRINRPAKPAAWQSCSV